jgi:plasmid stabilization system protein ParE
MRKIYLLPQAEENLNAITEPLYSDLLHKIRLLHEFPELGPALEGAFTGYRSLNASPFRVLYRIVSPERIEIAYIFHGKRHFSP